MTSRVQPVQADNPPRRVIDRITITPPDRVIQVERLRVSKEHESSVAAAIRAGRRLAGKSD